MSSLFVALIFTFTTAGILAPALGGDLKPDRLKLWEIVHDQCLPNQEQAHNPSPCVDVDVADGEERGYAILHDINGKAQFLLIPTRRVTGIESATILEVDTPDYWDEAWKARANVSAMLQKPLSRSAIGLAVNSSVSRSQDQLHIHITCLLPEVKQKLEQHTMEIGTAWSSLGFDLAGQRYKAMRIESPELRGANPFTMASNGLHIDGPGMAKETLVIVGASFGAGKDGFLLLEDRAGAGGSDLGHGEDLLDPSCAVATASP